MKEAGGEPGPPITICWISSLPPADGWTGSAHGLFGSVLVGRLKPIKKDDQPVGFVNVKPPDVLPGPIGYGPVMRSTNLSCAAVRHWSLSASLHCRLAGL